MKIIIYIFLLLIILFLFLFLLYYFIRKTNTIENLTFEDLKSSALSNDFNQALKIDIPVFYINLAKDKDRYRFMEKQFQKYKITNYQRIEGIEGKHILRETQFSNFVNRYFEKHSRNEIGCSLSHIKAIKQAKEMNIPYALIMEDDCDFTMSNFSGRTITEIISIAPVDWEIIVLSSIVKLYDRKKPLFFKPNIRGFGSAAYIVNLQKVHFLNLSNIKWPKIGIADYFLYDLLNTYVYNFPVFTTNDFQLLSTLHVSHQIHHKKAILRNINLFKEVLVLFNNDRKRNQYKNFQALKDFQKLFDFPYALENIERSYYDDIFDPLYLSILTLQIPELQSPKFLKMKNNNYIHLKTKKVISFSEIIELPKNKVNIQGTDFLIDSADFPELCPKAIKELQKTRNIIWQYWEGNLPGYINLCFQTVDKIYKDDFWIIRLNDESVRKILRTIKPSFSMISPTGMKADYIRFSLLYEYGGVWLDADTIATKKSATEFINKQLKSFNLTLFSENRDDYYKDPFSFMNPVIFANKESIYCKYFKDYFENLNWNKNIAWIKGTIELGNFIRKYHSYYPKEYISFPAREYINPIHWKDYVSYFWETPYNKFNDFQTYFICLCNNITPKDKKLLSETEILNGKWCVSSLFRNLLL